MLGLHYLFCESSRTVRDHSFTAALKSRRRYNQTLRIQLLSYPGNLDDCGPLRLAQMTPAIFQQAVAHLVFVQC